MDGLSQRFDAAVVLGAEPSFVSGALAPLRRIQAELDAPQDAWEGLAPLGRRLAESGVLRPLLLLSSPAHLLAFERRCAGLKIWALSGAELPRWSRRDQARAMATADVIWVDTADVLLGLSAPIPSAVLTRIGPEVDLSLPRRPGGPRDQARVLVLYDERWVRVGTVREHLESLGRAAGCEVYFAPAIRPIERQFDLELFDAVVVHYSVRLIFQDELDLSFSEAIRRFSGLKVLFIQDEYDFTERSRQAMEHLQIHRVYTCVPPEELEKVYPRARFPFVDFVHTLTGFVPSATAERAPPRPLAERPLRLAYRGRALPFVYGDLGREKLIIGQRMRQICAERGIPADIDWREEARIYGPDWNRFLESARATLGTESGSNIFDFDGQLKAALDEALKKDPALSYEEAHRTYLASHEGRVRMNQISPRIFEAIAARTALVLFEGTYSGIIQPDLHFIPLKKDFSNVEEVLAKLEDLPLLEKMTARAYQDVVASGRWDEAAFALQLGHELRAALGRGLPVAVVKGVLGRVEEGRAIFDPELQRRLPADAVQAVDGGLRPRAPLPEVPAPVRRVAKTAVRTAGRIASLAGADAEAVERALLGAAKDVSRRLRRTRGPRPKKP